MEFSTQAIRLGYTQTEQKEHSEAIFPTSSFTFDSAEDAARTFAKEQEGNVYARFTNPTVDSFAKRLAILEHGECGIATSSGMAAIFATIMALLKNGDHLVASKSMFGTTIVLLNNFVKNYGIEVSFVDLENLTAWEDAIQNNTKMFLLETPSNPLGEVIDLQALSTITKRHDILLAVDNAVLTPYLQQPLTLGADIVIHSATKYIDGQGRGLAGAIITNTQIGEQIASFVRSTGPSLSPFNAWSCLKGLETLSLRMEKHCSNALALAQYLEQQPWVTRVYYLGLPSHKHHTIAKQQQNGFGALVSFDVGSKEQAFKVINNTKIFSITANLGDAKTTITHPATTTHGRLSDMERKESGITDGLIRVSVGLEDINDIITNLKGN
jgi:O-succinylhomoserine sulfhydrylase